VKVARAAWADAALGLGQPLDGSARSQRTLDDFAALRARTYAEPRLLVHYVREAYASVVDGYARVTFDRDLRAQDQRLWSFQADEDRWTRLHDAAVGMGAHAPVVLELKCETRIPRWMVRLIQSRQLRHRGYSKYSTGVLLTGCREVLHALPTDGDRRVA
jgi:hypothetical protein